MKKVIALLLVVGTLVFYNSKIANTLYTLKNEIFNKNNTGEIVLVQNVNGTKSENDNIETTIGNFRNIKIGDKLDTVMEYIGSPSRIDESEYNFKWYVYNQYREKFVMVGIKDDIVVGLYSNSIDSCENGDIKLNKDRNFVRENYSPLEYRLKGNTKYIINSENQYDVINENKNYITVFYDIYEESRICSYQIIDEKVESQLDGMYAKDSEKLRESFELQVIDLANSIRIQKGLEPFKESEKAKVSSRKHSQDMIDKEFFDHVNKENKSPFDRMKKEGIVYQSAGENIAAGQVSAIYAHEAWMNSKGHRKNILGDYKYIGVGVKFGGYYTIYYTQNFYT
ncbi:MAG: CAP-associated domain-containing protein [Romboutsia sp.]